MTPAAFKAVFWSFFGVRKGQATMPMQGRFARTR
jgi:Protein of unknown function (DUF2970)